MSKELAECSSQILVTFFPFRRIKNVMNFTFSVRTGWEKKMLIFFNFINISERGEQGNEEIAKKNFCAVQSFYLH